MYLKSNIIFFRSFFFLYKYIWNIKSSVLIIKIKVPTKYLFILLLEKGKERERDKNRKLLLFN